MVYGIVKQSGGHITVESELGRGSTFSIYLPEVEGCVEEPASGSIAPAPVRGCETILLVEDEETVRDLVREVLGMHGYQVLEASNAAKAITVGEQHTGPIDLLVTDVVMPGMSGKELAERLGTTRPAMKVLYMSGYTDSAIVNHGVLVPGTAFLQKPFTPTVLARRVGEVLHPGRSGPGGVGGPSGFPRSGGAVLP
jgi:CheY-like chemotaxis protein